MTERLVQITPNVVFSTDVFPQVDIVQRGAPSRKRAAELGERGIDPRQIDLWGDDPKHARIAPMP